MVVAVLAAATVGAFFVVQHLKVTTPLIAGQTPPRPAVINPVSGGVCDGVNYRRARVSFFLLHRADDVGVYVLNRTGTSVATLASNRHMARGLNIPPGVFIWNGREDNGKIAPDGTYTVQIDLIHQGRTYVLGPPEGGPPWTITVQTRMPCAPRRRASSGVVAGG